MDTCTYSSSDLDTFIFDHVHERLLLPYRIAQMALWTGGKPVVREREREFSFAVRGSWWDDKEIEFWDHSSSAREEYNHK